MINRRELSNIYLFSYIILLFSSLFEIININEINYIVFQIGSIVGIIINILLFLNQIYKTNYAYILIFLIIVFIVGSIFDFPVIPLELIELFSFLLNINLLNLKKFINTDITLRIIFFISIIFLNFIKIIPNSASAGNGLGFRNPDSASLIVFGILFSIILFYRNYNKVYQYSIGILMLLGLIILIFYDITKCRALIISGLFLILLIVLKRFHIIHLIIIHLSGLVGLSIPLISTYLIYKFNPISSMWLFINKILANRLIMQSTFLNAEPLKLCGQHISEFVINVFSNNYMSNAISVTGAGDALDFTIDNSYIFIAYHFGILGLILSMFILFKFILMASKCDDDIICILIVSLLIYSSVDSDLLSICNLLPIIYIAYISNYMKNKNRLLHQEVGA